MFTDIKFELTSGSCV